MKRLVQLCSPGGLLVRWAFPALLITQAGSFSLATQREVPYQAVLLGLILAALDPLARSRRDVHYLASRPLTRRMLARDAGHLAIVLACIAAAGALAVHAWVRLGWSVDVDKKFSIATAVPFVFLGLSLGLAYETLIPARGRIRWAWRPIPVLAWLALAKIDALARLSGERSLPLGCALAIASGAAALLGLRLWRRRDLA